MDTSDMTHKSTTKSKGYVLQGMHLMVIFIRLEVYIHSEVNIQSIYTLKASMA